MFKVMYARDLPDDPRVGPAADSAVQAHTLLLPHGVGAWFNHKLWGVHQAVFVHALKVFPVFMDLQTEQSCSIKSLRTIVPLPNINLKHNFTRKSKCIAEAQSKLLHSQIEQGPNILFLHMQDVYYFKCDTCHVFLKKCHECDVCCSLCPMNS